MDRRLALTTLLVDDYARGIEFFVTQLDFTLIENNRLDDAKRWVVVSPAAPAAGAPLQGALLLALADGDTQQQRIGAQTGGRVAFFLHTDDFARDYAAYQARGVNFIEPPRAEAYGQVVVFEDPWGNRWDLLEPE
ncbi:MAG: VOC family protein [Pseudomonadota bacterium]